MVAQALMARLLFRILARWPGVSFTIAAALAITCLVLICSWILVWREFPSAPAGEVLYYVTAAGNAVWEHVRYMLRLSSNEGTHVPLLAPTILSIWVATGLMIMVRVLGARIAFPLICSAPHDQIIGQGRLPGRLASELRRDGELAVQYQRIPVPLFANGVLHLPLSKRRPLGQGGTAMVVDDDDVVNLRALENLGAAEPAMIRIEHPGLRLNAARKDSANAGVHRFFSVHELGARLASRRHPLVASAGIEGCFEIVCGAGQTAQAVASHALRSHHYGFRQAPRIVLLGPESEVLLGRINAAYPELAAWTGLEARVLPYMDRAGLLENLLSLGGALRIQVCEERAEELLPLLEALAGLADDLEGHIERVFVYSATFSPDLLQLVRARCRSLKECALIDLAWSLESGEFLTQSRLDRMAITMHEAYLEQAMQDAAFGCKPSHASWSKLPEGFRDENRNLADHLFLKLAESGVVAIDGMQPTPSGLALADWSRLRDGDLDALARAEHARWSASRILRGWVYGGDRDDARLRHPDLLSWEALSEEVRAYDRKMIQALPEVYARTGLQLYSARPAVEELLCAIREDRAVAAGVDDWVRLRKRGSSHAPPRDTGWELLVESEDEAVLLLEQLLEDWPELSDA